MWQFPWQLVSSQSQEAHEEIGTRGWGGGGVAFGSIPRSNTQAGWKQNQPPEAQCLPHAYRLGNVSDVQRAPAQKDAICLDAQTRHRKDIVLLPLRDWEERSPRVPALNGSFLSVSHA